MSMTMYPEEAPGLPIPPGGQDTGVPPMDALSSTQMPAEGGLEGLMAALGGGGGEGAPEGAAAPEERNPIDLIREAMKLLMMAMAKEEDDERGHGIVKGMGALQGILGGEQKRLGQQAGI